MAFGSGLHPSTRLILLELEEIEVIGKRVLDVGTGSGILALAAEALGASMVVGIDVDPQAVWVAHRTRSQQHWEVGLQLAVSPVEGVVTSTFDVALCNMLPGTSSRLLPAIRRRLVRGGRIVLSGMVGEETEVMTDELASQGCRVEGVGELDGWTAVRVVCDGP
jgi:ribosomal protein L11 methyltransferase